MGSARVSRVSNPDLSSGTPGVEARAEDKYSQSPAYERRCEGGSRKPGRYDCDLE